MTPDVANNRIEIDQDGIYEVNSQISFSGTGGTTFDFFIYVNAAPSNYAFQRKLGTGGDVGSASVVGILDLSDGDLVDVYLQADGAAKSITPSYAQLFLHRIG